jgi:hypothetical protein
MNFQKKSHVLPKIEKRETFLISTSLATYTYYLLRDNGVHPLDTLK